MSKTGMKVETHTHAHAAHRGQNGGAEGYDESEIMGIETQKSARVESGTSN